MVWRDQIWRGISIVQKHIQHIHIPAQTIQSPKMCSACNDLNPAHCLHILIMPYFRCGCYFQLSINSVIKIFERSKCGIEYHLEFRFIRDALQTQTYSCFMPKKTRIIIQRCNGIWYQAIVENHDDSNSCYSMRLLCRAENEFVHDGIVTWS